MKEHTSKGIAVFLVCLGLSILMATIVCSVLAVRWSNAELEVQRQSRDETARTHAAFELAQREILKTIMQTLEELPNPDQLCGDQLIQVAKQALEVKVRSN